MTEIIETIAIIAVSIFSLAFISGVVIITISVHNIITSKREFIKTRTDRERYEFEYLNNKLEFERLKHRNGYTKLQYTEKLLEYIRMVATQIAVLKFRTFQDGHEMDKVTRMNIKNLVSDVATETRDSINFNNIDIENTLVTSEFLTKYLVEVSVIAVKEMLNKAIED